MTDLYAIKCAMQFQITKARALTFQLKYNNMYFYSIQIFFVQIILRESTFNLQLLELDWLNDSVKNFQCDSHSKKLSGQPINVVTKVSFFSHPVSGHEF